MSVQYSFYGNEIHKTNKRLWLLLLLSADINECETLKAVCNGSTFCKNTDGGYVCTCNEGYKVDDNNTCHGKSPLISFS